MFYNKSQIKLRKLTFLKINKYYFEHLTEKCI